MGRGARPPPRPPEPAALFDGWWPKVGRELLGLAAALAVLALMLLLIDHVGGAGR